MKHLNTPVALMLALLLAFGSMGYKVQQKTGLVNSAGEAVLGVSEDSTADEAAAGDVQTLPADPDPQAPAQEPQTPPADPDAQAAAQDAQIPPADPDTQAAAQEPQSTPAEPDPQAAAQGTADPSDDMASPAPEDPLDSPTPAPAPNPEQPAAPSESPIPQEEQEGEEAEATPAPVLPCQVTFVAGDQRVIREVALGEVLAAPKDPALEGARFLYWYDPDAQPPQTAGPGWKPEDQAYAFGQPVQGDLLLIALFERQEMDVPQETPVPEVEGSVEVWASVGPGDAVFYGDVVTFYSRVEGYAGLDIRLQWQSSPDGASWTDVKGANGDSLSIVLSESNYRTQYRLRVITPEA